MARKTTIKEWAITLRAKFDTHEEFVADLNRVITEAEEDEKLYPNSVTHQLKFYKRVRNKLDKISI